MDKIKIISRLIYNILIYEPDPRMGQGGVSNIKSTDPNQLGSTVAGNIFYSFTCCFSPSQYLTCPVGQRENENISLKRH